MAGEAEAPQSTLRDSYAGAFDAEEAKQAPATETPAPAAAPQAEPAAATPQGAAAPAPKEGDRPRDSQGRFIEKTPEEKGATPQAAAPAPVPEVKRPPRPSSWKKDYWDAFDKLDPKVAEYINQREGEFAKGVSTYKQEWERARPLLEAIAPYQDHFSRTGIQPAQLFARYAELDRTLSYGTPEQKLGIFLKAAQDYGVPVHQMFIQGQDGKLYQNPNVQPYQPQQQQQAQQPQQNVETLIEQKLNQRTAQQNLAVFEQEAPTKYPHYEALREEMARLLDAGLAQDLPSAYDKALRMNDELFTAAQEEKRKADEAERQRKAAEDAQRARRQAVSVKSATPATAGSKDGKKGLRSAYEDAFSDAEHRV